MLFRMMNARALKIDINALSQTIGDCVTKYDEAFNALAELHLETQKKGVTGNKINCGFLVDDYSTISSHFQTLMTDMEEEDAIMSRSPDNNFGVIEGQSTGESQEETSANADDVVEEIDGDATGDVQAEEAASLDEAVEVLEGEAEGTTQIEASAEEVETLEESVETAEPVQSSEVDAESGAEPKESTFLGMKASAKGSGELSEDALKNIAGKVSELGGKAKESQTGTSSSVLDRFRSNVKESAEAPKENTFLGMKTSTEGSRELSGDDLKSIAGKVSELSGQAKASQTGTSSSVLDRFRSNVKESAEAPEESTFLGMKTSTEGSREFSEDAIKRIAENNSSQLDKYRKKLRALTRAPEILAKEYEPSSHPDEDVVVYNASLCKNGELISVIGTSDGVVTYQKENGDIYTTDASNIHPFTQKATEDGYYMSPVNGLNDSVERVSQSTTKEYLMDKNLMGNLNEFIDPNGAKTATVKVNGGTLNLREDVNGKGSVIGTIQDGAELEIIDDDPNSRLVRVIAPDGTVGKVSRKFLNISENGETPKPAASGGTSTKASTSAPKSSSTSGSSETMAYEEGTLNHDVKFRLDNNQTYSEPYAAGDTIKQIGDLGNGYYQIEYTHDGRTYTGTMSDTQFEEIQEIIG